jgi:hypothetical protein
MARWWNLWVGSGLATLAAAALLLNWLAPESACRWNLCPESVQIAEAHRLLLEGSPNAAREAVKLYQGLIRRNPASAYRWCDLAEAWLAAENPAEARAAFEQAERLAPSTPQILLRVASFHLQQQEWEAALRRMSRILALTPAYDRLIFSYYEKLALPVDLVLSCGIPLEPRPAQSYLRDLLPGGQRERLSVVWEWIRLHGFQTGELVSEYVSYLLRNQRAEEAAAEWARYLGPRAGDYPLRNRIYNGDFEQELSPSPFDWSFASSSAARAVREPGAACSGQWSLRIDFTGAENVAFQHVSQLALVRPGRYRFHACVKSESLTTDQGVGIRVRDYETPARFEWSSERLLGSTDWRNIDAELRIPDGTRLIVVQVFRAPSIKFDNQISGTFWLDHVVLEPLMH